MLNRKASLWFALTFAGIVGLWSGETSAAQSSAYKSNAVAARLLTAQDGVPEHAETVSGALHLALGKGWKTYWRSPGEVGTPPSIDWSGSINVKEAEFFWPAPTRFRAFGIENFGYSKEVAFPLKIILEKPGEPVALRAKVNLLVCSTICVPEIFDLALTLGPGNGIDQDAAALIAASSRRVPGDGSRIGLVFQAGAISENGQELVVTVQSTRPLKNPDIFPEMGPSASFGAPDIRLGEGGKLLWASLPILSPPEGNSGLTLTVTDGDRAATFPAPLSSSVPTPPFSLAATAPDALTLAWIAFVAVLGGFILNLMPCVLPVLSIKLGSAIKAGERPSQKVRIGFLIAALGVLSLMWLLAAATIIAKSIGLSVGWGLQFQSPIFLTFIIAILAIFSANLFGLFEMTLPDALNQRLASGAGGSGYLGDFATGAFAAILATPCSAPFLGTAVAFALAGRATDIVLIFTALGIGLALPYFAVAAVPKVVQSLPRPGPWMIWLKIVLGLLLAGTALWLVWVLSRVASLDVAMAVVSLLLVAVLLLGPGKRFLSPAVRFSGLSLAFLASLAVPTMVRPSANANTAAAPSQTAIPWQTFDRAAIPRLVSEGKVVFVDVTADWCITCKANKALVTERGIVAETLASPSIVPMVADWTKPDKAISRYLEAYGRYGIPFNVVYGPAEPEGIVLPEILTTDKVIQAIQRAGVKSDATVTAR